MEYFRKLGEMVEKLYREQGYRELSFPDVSERAFAELPPVTHVRPFDALAWICRTQRLPEQRSINHLFDDPITMYAGRGFTIELLFWFENTATIHQHSWCGAYNVLAGSSVHTEYSFEPTERLNSRVSIGVVSWKRTHLLGTGQTQRVLLGRDFIHTAFHLESPSVSVILKSSMVPGVDVGYDYLPPSLALDPYFRPALPKRQLQVLGLIRRVNRSAYVPLLAEMVAEQDFHGACLLLIDNAPHLDDEQLEAVLDQGRRRHGARFDLLAPVFAELARHADFAGTRLHVTDCEDRFLLGCLMHAPHRVKLLELVQARAAGRDPVDWIRERLRAISSLPGAPGEPNPLGVPLGELELDVLDGIARGLVGRDLHARLAQIYGAAQVERRANHIERLADALVRVPIFRVLAGRS